MGCFTPDAPAPRNLGAESRESLRAQVDIAPEVLANEERFRPRYNALTLQGINDILNGTQASTRTQNYTERVEWSPEEYRAAYQQRYGNGGQPGATGGLGGLVGGVTGTNGPGGMPSLDVMRSALGGPQYRNEERTRDIVVPGQRGFLDIFANDVMPTLDAAQRKSTNRQRLSDIRAVEKLGGRATAAIRAANPEQAALMGELNRQSLEELKMGATLDPSLRREVSQGARAAWADRGLLSGPGSAIDETFATGMAAEQLRGSRRNFGMQIANMNQSQAVDPMMAVLGRSSGTAGLGNAMGMQASGMAGGGGPQLFNPLNGYASDLFNTNYNAEAAAEIAGANNKAGILGGAMSY